MITKYITVGFISAATILVGAAVTSYSAGTSDISAFSSVTDTRMMLQSQTKIIWAAPLPSLEANLQGITSQKVSIDPNAARTSDTLKTAPTVPESANAFVIPYEGEITFGGGEWVYPKTAKAMQRAISSVGDAVSVCVDGKCFNKCDHLAGDIWGYEEASGYLSAATHWQTAKTQGIARVGDKEPPLGALLFWETGRPFGHVATYIGNGLVVTNSGGEFGSDVYVAYADAYDKYGWKYLGWADPVFFGESPGSAL